MGGGRQHQLPEPGQPLPRPVILLKHPALTADTTHPTITSLVSITFQMTLIVTQTMQVIMLMLRQETYLMILTVVSRVDR